MALAKVPKLANLRAVDSTVGQFTSCILPLVIPYGEYGTVTFKYPGPEPELPGTRGAGIEFP
jgi:hypothetical protein